MPASNESTIEGACDLGSIKCGIGKRVKRYKNTLSSQVGGADVVSDRRSQKQTIADEVETRTNRFCGGAHRGSKSPDGQPVKKRTPGRKKSTKVDT